MTRQSIFRRLLPPLVLSMFATLAVMAQPGVWTETATKPGGLAHALYAAHFLDGTTGLVAGANSSGSAAVLYRTTDAGATWTQLLPAGIGTSTAINDIHFLPGNQIGTIAGNGNYVARTTDGGATWSDRSIPNGLWSSLTDIQAVFFLTASRGWVVGRVAGANGPRMAMTVDGGLSWSVVPMTGASNNLHDIDFFDFDHGLAVGTGNPSRITFSSNSGTTWHPDTTVGPGLQTESVSMYGLDAVEGTATGYAVGGKNFGSPIYPVIRRTTDYGKSWSNLVSGSITGLQKPASDVIALGTSVIFVSGQDRSIVRSIDGGATWTAETVNASSASTDLRKFSHTSDNHLWVVGTSGTVLRTRLVPDATFSAPDTLRFGTLCPDETTKRTLTIGNTGLGVLSIAGTSIIQPPGGMVQFALVVPTVARVWPRGSATQEITVRVLPGTPAGTYVGEIRLSTNDENGAGADAFKTIRLSVTVEPNGVVVDSSVVRDLGAVRVGGLRAVSLAGLLVNASARCTAPVDTVILARGLEFRLVPPFVGRDTLRPGGRATVLLEFAPSRTCARYDTLIVVQAGGATRLRIPIVGTGVEPSFAAEPADTLRFGGVQVGSTGSATLKLLNRKPGTCLDRTALTSLEITGPNAAEFATTTTFEPGRTYIAPDGEVLVPFTATPAATGVRIAYATITHDATGGAHRVVLLVRGVDAELAASTDEIVFPVTEVGTRRDTTLAAALRNLGSTPVTITSAVVTGPDDTRFPLVLPTVGRTIAGRTNDSIVLGFQPNRVGTFSGTLVLGTDIGTTISIRLRGEGDVAAGSLGRNPITFTPTAPGACREVTVERFLRNDGRIPLRISSIVVVPHPSGSPADAARFTIVSPTIPPERTLAPGDSLAVLVRFCPERIGEHLAAIEIASNIPGARLLDTLAAEGVRARVVATDTVVFDPTRLGTQRDSMFAPFLVNGEPVALDVTAVSIIGADPADFSIDLPTTPFSVAASSDLPATLRFTPRARGVRSATLRIESSQGAHEVVLVGRGIYPQIEITGDLAPRVRVGSTRALDVTITNRGDDTGAINAVSLSGPPVYAITASSVPTTLSPGASTTVTISFAPIVECEQPTVLQVNGEGTTSLALSGDTTLIIAGVGVAPRLTARDDTVDFGAVTVGAARDSLLADFVANVSIADPSLLCVDSTTIDAISLVGPDAASFELVAPADPRLIVRPGEPLAMTVRFRPSRPGAHTAALAIAFDGHPDSLLHVGLAGLGSELPEIAVGLSFGADHETRPGAMIRVPIILAGNVSAAAIDSLVVGVAFDRSLLRLERVIGVGGTSATATPTALGAQEARATITLAAPEGLGAGTVAELELTVMLGRVLASDLRADSAVVPSRPEVRITSDSATVSIEEFCDANGRLVSFGGSLLVKVSPNPAGDVVTLSYDIPASGPTRLAIHDSRGDVVATIVDGVLDAGGYAVTLDTRALATGTYYCLLTAGRFESAAVIRIER